MVSGRVYLGRGGHAWEDQGGLAYMTSGGVLGGPGEVHLAVLGSDLAVLGSDLAGLGSIWPVSGRSRVVHGSVSGRSRDGSGIDHGTVLGSFSGQFCEFGH